MVRELLSLSLFLMAALAGVARFREHGFWDTLSLWIANGTLFVGTLTLISVTFEREFAHLVPLSLLLLMYGSSFLKHNFFTQIICLPLVIGELLMSIMFSEIRELFATPAALLVAIVFHFSFFGLVMKLTPDSDRQKTRFQLPLARDTSVTHRPAASIAFGRHAL